MIMEKRKHRKTIITNVNPRPQWTALRTKNQRLIFGYLVAKTSIKRKGVELRLDRHEVLTDKEKCWNGVYVTNEELADFLILSTGLSKNACRNTIKRTLEHLEKVGYIVVHQGAVLVNRYDAKRAIEVLWDDKKYSFITPLKTELSNSSVTKIDSSVTKKKFYRNTSVTKIDSSVTKTTKNVTLENATYGQTKPRIDDFEGAYINNKYIITESHTKNATPVVGQPSSDTSKNETTEVTSQPPATHDRLLAMTPGTNFYNQDDLHPAFRVRQDPSRTRFDKPADLLSFWETKGVKEYPGLIEVAQQFIEHVKSRYGYDCSFIFEAENYRRLICPDLRMDLPLEFGPLPDDLRDNHVCWLPEYFEKHMVSKIYQDCPDVFHRIVTFMRYAPRGIIYYRDSGAYWQPPLMPMALDYSSYTKSPKTTASKFHRDASLSQLREIARAAYLPEVEVNGKMYTGLYFNLVLKRQIFWLAGVTAMSREALEDLLPRFEKDLLQNSKSIIYSQYQKKIMAGDFGDTNLINWFRDYCFRYHHNGWYIDRVKNDEGVLMLSALGSNCDTSGASTGTIAFIPTPWGHNREMFFTDLQWTFYQKFKNTLILADIGQDSL